ncbi:11352_t:CDS:1 [Funneliformis mosseae]|uniref:11352_t:CDS:1 n=1 Tax=Funneliformis mosseae TaxID=27381 RepID=A0A9N9G3Q4_FUNMO|nr:11352_t:CDS:1 [Funneliformis mosseae]
MLQIFDCIRDQGEGIYSALLVNRYWCRNIIPILWEQPFQRFSKVYHSQPTQYLKNRSLRLYQPSNNKLLNTLFSCLPEQDNKSLNSKLSQYRVKIPQSQQTLFNYAYFLQEFSYKDLELVILSSLQRWYTNTLSHDSFYPQIHLISTALCKLFLQRSNLHSLYFEKNFAKLDIPNFTEIDNKRPALSQLSHFSFTYSEPITTNILNLLKIISNFCSHITFLEFKLKSADYNIDVMEAIVNIINSQDKITHFSIEDISNDGAEPIIFSLKNHVSNLISLRLSHVQLTESCVDLISQFNNLNFLTIDNCNGLSNEILYSHFLLKKLIINTQRQDITLPLLRKFGKNLKFLGLSVYDINLAEQLLGFCPRIDKIHLNIHTEDVLDYEELKRKEASWKNIIKSAYPHKNITLSIGY